MSVRAPRLTGRGWLNTGGAALSLEQLRGKFVLLDFWTFACVNCLHVIEELRPLEQRFADVLVTIGVHSPKFPHEGDPQAVIDAVERYRVGHPVLDDADLVTWDAYAAKAWPTLVLIDPRGYIVADLAGEHHTPQLAALIEQLSAVHEADGTLRRGDAPAPAVGSGGTGSGGTGTGGGRAAAGSRLRFPGGLLALPAGRYGGGGYLVSDTAHQQLVLLAGDLSTQRARIGTGERRRADGGPDQAGFEDPLGAALLPAEIADRVGYDVLIADGAGNALRALRLADLSVHTVAVDLSTPWDVAWFDGAAVIAMAGVHQLWAFDPVEGALRVLAGTGREGLVDGAAARSWFAQPSGLAVGDGGRVLWVADAETSALRRLWSADDGSLQVRTVVGQGLFEFGGQDGGAAAARLQHPLGVAVLPDGSVAIADTYNGAVRRYDPVTDQVSTLASGLAEPSALVLAQPSPGEPDVAGPGEVAELVVAELVVAESAAHRLERVPLPAGVTAARSQTAGAGPVRRPVLDLSPGALELSIAFRPPPGQKLDDSLGDPTWLDVAATPPEVLPGGAGAGPGLTRSLRLEEGVSGGRVDGVLLIAARASSCDQEDDVGAACYLHRRQWEIPFRLVPGSAEQLALDLTAAGPPASAGPGSPV